MFLAFFSLIGFTLILSRYSKQPFNILFFTSLNIFIVTLFIFGLLNLLKEGIYFFEIISIFYLVIYTLKNYEKCTNYISLNYIDIVIYISILLLGYLITRSEYYLYVINWDDFSHWARAAKFVILENRIYYPGDPRVMFAHYPVGSSLLIYIFNNSIEVQENNFYFAYFIYYWTGLYCLINFKKSNIYILLIFIILISNNLTPLNHTLQVDQLIGVMLGVSCSIYIVNKNNPPILYFALLFIMTITKQTASIVALQGVLIGFLVNNSQENFKNIVNFCKGLTVIFIGSFLWILYLKINIGVNSVNINQSSISIVKIYKEAINIDINLVNVILNNFFNKLNLYTNYKIGNLKAFNMMIGILSLLYITRKFNAHYHSLILIYISNIFILLVYYILFFDSNEAVALASFERYLSTFFIGYSVIVFTLINVQFTNEISKKYINIYIIYLFLVCISIYFYQATFIWLFLFFIHELQFKFKSYSFKTSLITVLFVSSIYFLINFNLIYKFIPDDKILMNLRNTHSIINKIKESGATYKYYIIDEYDTGTQYSYLQYYYYLFNYNFNSSCYNFKIYNYSISEKNESCVYKIDELRSMIIKYDYIVFKNPAHSSLFKIIEDNFYLKNTEEGIYKIQGLK